jgi:RNA polymerase sigma factor (sigma-70 family)
MPTRLDLDEELLRALREREPTAAEALITAYGNRAYRLAVRITGNAQDAEEAVQDAFWSVVRKIGTFRGDSAFGSWVYRIVSNAAYEKARRRRQAFVDISLEEVLPPFDEDGRHAGLLSGLVIEHRRPGGANRASGRAGLGALRASSPLSGRGRPARRRRVVDGRGRRRVGDHGSDSENPAPPGPTVAPQTSIDVHDQRRRGRRRAGSRGMPAAVDARRTPSIPNLDDPLKRSPRVLGCNRRVR